MTDDKELIARLRITAEWVIGKEAADRIEQLAATNEALVKERDDLEATAIKAAVVAQEQRARAERLEAALREILEKPRNADLTYAELFAEVVSEARAALKGDDHD